MANKEPSHLLKVLFHLAKNAKRIEATNDPERFKIVLAEKIDTGEAKEIDNGEVTIERVTNSKGEKIDFSNAKIFEADTQFVIRVPRRPKNLFVAGNLDDLLQNESAFDSEPHEYLIFDLKKPKNTFWSEGNHLPGIIQSYRSAVELVKLLKSQADVVSHTPLQTTFFDVDKVEIQISFKETDLEGVIPVDELKAFLEAPCGHGARRDAFRGTLWDKLKHYGPDERLRRLLKASRFNQFLRTVKHNFRLDQRDHRLDRRLEAARAEQRSISEDVGKLVLSLETKALLIPGTLILAARFLEPGKGITLGNSILVASTFTLSLILFFGYRSQKQIVNALQSDIKDALDLLGDSDEESAMNVRFQSLSSRLKIVEASKKALFVISIILSFAALVASVFNTFGSSTTQHSPQRSEPSTTANQDSQKSVREAFANLSAYFSKGIDTLNQQGGPFTAEFLKIHEQRFVASLYKNGNLQHEIVFWVGGMVGRNSISYHFGRNISHTSENTFSGSIRIEEESGHLASKQEAYGIANRPGSDKSPHEGLWLQFVEPMTRR